MKKYATLLLFLASSSLFLAQDNLSSDELFLKARSAAFEQKDYHQAITIAQKALEQSPDYTDISVFLGRLYTWNNETEKARAVFQTMDDKNVQDQDFFLAYASLEYWNDNSTKALSVIEKGLTHHPKAEDLLLLKAKILFSNNDYEAAEETLASLLLIDPKNTEARELSSRIKEYSSKNAVGISYNYTHFDKQFSDDWHIVSLSYRRTTKYGSVIVKGNYANKFASDGTQLEIEAYPKISKMFYMYVAAGFSNNVGIFPKYRTGASLYANLPKSFEAEIGYRQLHFSNDIWMYTASVGKYYKNYWFNFKTYLTPDKKNISHSYTATVRYYTKGANDYFGIQVGTGISPEGYMNNLLTYETYKLKTFKVGANYNFSVAKTNQFSVSAAYFNQEYLPNTTGNQYDLSIGYTKTF